MTNQDKVKELIELRAQAKLGGRGKAYRTPTQKREIYRSRKNRHVAGRK